MHAATPIDALERMLKGRGLTYAEVAKGLDMSEAGVKRGGFVSVQRNRGRGRLSIQCRSRSAAPDDHQ